MKKKIIIIPHNHFDVVWRRCFKEKSEYEHLTITPYSEIERVCFDRWMDYDQTITEGQAAIVRNYMEENPQRIEPLKEMARSGKFAFVNAGEVVQDTNLPTPEGLIRNFLVSVPDYKDMNPEDPRLRKIVWLEDIFGLSANYPQILKKVGAEAGCRFCYKQPDKTVWQGIDGTKIAVLDRFYFETSAGTFEKHPPCPECSGKGCESCSSTGMAFIPEMGYDALYNTLRNAAAIPEKLIVVWVGGEELFPEKDLNAAVEAVSKEIKEVSFQIGTILDAYEVVKNDIAQSLKNDECCVGEFNPVFSGCYVSRIKIKQRIRDISYRLCAAEAKLVARGAGTEYPSDLTEAWENITFCHFHDTITGTHCDSAYMEAQKMLDKAEGIAKKYIPDTKKSLSDHSPSHAIESNSVTWGKNEIFFDDFGITRILHNKMDFFGQRGYGRLQREFRIGELCLEPDFGDAWATRICPWFHPHDNQSLLQLGNFQKLIEANSERIVWEGVYRDDSLKIRAKGCDPMVKTLRWKTIVTRGINDAPDFTTEIDWDTHSKRIRVLFPVASAGDSAWYEIPFGYAERKYDPQQVNYHEWSPNSMDFPAQNWVCKETDRGSAAVAVFNRGIPSFRWIPGCFEMSLLRSPEALFVANESRNYDFADFDGLRDAGKHTFHYCVMPFENRPSAFELSQIGFCYNMIYDFALPCRVDSEIIVTACKPASYANGIVIRFYNPQNKEVEAKIIFHDERSICECNMLEEPVEPASPMREYTRTTKPFEIITLLIQK